MWLSLALALPFLAQRTDSWMDVFQRAERTQAAGDLEGTERWLRGLLELDPENATVAVHLAAAFARGGRAEDALTWLERAVEWSYADAAVIEWDPDFAELRAEPRFTAIVRSAGAIPVEAPEVSIHWNLAGKYAEQAAPDGRRAVRAGERALLWDPLSDEPVAVLEASATGIDFAIDPGGEVVVGVHGFGVTERPRVRCWEIADGSRRWDVQLPPGLGTELRSTIRFTSDGEGIVLIGSKSTYRLSVDDGAVATVALLDRSTLVKAEEEWPAIEMPDLALDARCLVRLDDRRLALVTGESEVRVIGVDTANLLSIHHLEVGHVRRLTRCGSWIVADGREFTAVLDPVEGSIRRVPGGRSWPSEAREQLLVRHRDSLRILDLRDRVAARELPIHERITAAAWSRDGRHLALATERHVRVWDVEANVVCYGPLEHQDTVHGLDFSPDGRRLATGCFESGREGREPKLRTWDVATGELVGAVSAPGMMFGVHTVRYTADGSVLWCVMESIPDIEARDAETLELRWAHRGFNWGPNWLRLEASASGRLFAAGDYDSRILDTSDGTLILAFDDDVTDLVPSSDGRRVFTIRGCALEILDGISPDLLVTRVEYPDGGELVWLPSLYYRGTPDALERAWLVSGGRASRLAAWTEQLYDPRRVAAGAAGVPVRAPSLR